MSTGKVILGILAGIAAGTTIGILMAPDSGKKTRKKIAQKGEDYFDAMEAKFNGLVDVVTSKFDSLKSQAFQTMEHDKAKVEDVLENISNKAK